MIDLNVYINKTVDFVIGDETINVKLPSANVMEKVAKIEKTYKDTDSVAYHKNRPAIAREFLNFNMNNRTFELKEVEALPEKVLEFIITEVMSVKVKAELDPNSKSQSPKAK